MAADSYSHSMVMRKVSGLLDLPEERVCEAMSGLAPMSSTRNCLIFGLGVGALDFMSVTKPMALNVEAFGYKLSVKGTLLGLFLSAKGFFPNPEKGQVILEKKINDVEVTDEVEGETIPR